MGVPAGRYSTRGPTSRYFAGSRDVQRSAGSTTWASRSTIKGIFSTTEAATSGRPTEAVVMTSPRDRQKRSAVRDAWHEICELFRVTLTHRVVGHAELLTV